MRKGIVILLLLLHIISCKSLDVKKEPIKKDPKSIASEMFEEIMQKSKKHDVEKQMNDFLGYVNDNNLDLSEIKTSLGEEITDQLITSILQTGWLGELLYLSRIFVKETGLLSDEDLDYYGKAILKYAKKLGYNLIKTVAVIIEYLVKDSMNISKTELFFKLQKIWF